MSLDTIAFFDVATPLEPNRLVEQLAATPAIAALVPRFGDQWDPKEWSVTPSNVDPRSIDLIGPGGIVLRLGRRGLEVYHLLRFTSFAGGGDDQRLLRRAFRAIARLVGSKRAVYTHELAASDFDPDLGTDEVIANLTAAAGPPAISFAELYEAEQYGPRSWYIDDFADLDAN